MEGNLLLAVYQDVSIMDFRDGLTHPFKIFDHIRATETAILHFYG